MATVLCSGYLNLVNAFSVHKTQNAYLPSVVWYTQGGGIMKVSLITRIETGHCSIIRNWASQHCGELSLLKSVSKGCKG